MRIKPGLIAALAVLGAGLSALWLGTAGFTILTAESARRLSVERNNEPLPAVLLRDQRGEVFSLNEGDGRLLLVEFIYTRCTTICRTLGRSFEYLAQELPMDKVRLLSISFDPSDDWESLADYGAGFNADPAFWQIARLEDPKDIPALLKTFGITVIADAYGGFEHNAAIHLVSRDGRLSRIFDHVPVTGALEEVRRWL